MNSVFKVFVLLWAGNVCGEVKRSICGEPEIKDDLACEGKHISLRCSRERPWIEIESAEYGRQQSEDVVCPRPQHEPDQNNNPPQSFRPCEQDVLPEVGTLCNDKKECGFIANSTIFPDPCPKVYKYLTIIYKCRCSKRYSRNEQSSASCFSSRKLVFASQTTVSSSRRSTAIGSPVLHNVTTTTTQPITTQIICPTSAGHTPCTQSVVITPSRSELAVVTGSRSLAIPEGPLKTTKGRKTFFILLELFIVYNEAVDENPSMAILWYCIGMILGLFSLTIVFLILGPPRKPEDKRLFRLSQVDGDESKVQSPTIETSSQLPGLTTAENENQNKEEARVKSSAVAEGRQKDDSSGGIGSSVSLCNASTLIYTNPLWIGLRQNIASATELSIEPAVPTTLEETNPTTTQKQEALDDDESDKTNEVGPLDSSSTNQQESTKETLDCESESPQNVHNKQKQTVIPDCNDPAAIPVGIPSRPADSFLLQDSLRSMAGTKEGPSKSSEDNTLSLKKAKPREQNCDGSYKSSSSKLLSKFGVKSDSHESIVPSNTSTTASAPSSRRTLSQTTRSSPCVYSEQFIHDDTHSPSSNSQGTDQVNITDGSCNEEKKRLVVLTKPVRSWSLDSQHHSETPLIIKPHPDDSEQTTDTKHNLTKTPDPNNAPLRTVSEGSDHEKLQHENSAQDASDSQRPAAGRNPNWPRGSHKARRQSSGYYSNSGSPSVENPLGLAKEETSSEQTKKSLKKAQNKGGVDAKKSANSTDDLPPLPPPPPPFIPIAPFPHLFGAGFQPCRTTSKDNPQQKNSKNNSEHKSCSRTAAKKVHFEPTTS